MDMQRKIGRVYTPPEPEPIWDLIARYESDEDMEDTAICTMFQRLTDDGTAWKLPSSYARMAVRLIMTGRVIWGPDAQASFEREHPLLFVPDSPFAPELHAVEEEEPVTALMIGFPPVDVT